MDQGHSTKKKGGHLKFHTKLALQLIAHSSSFKHTSPVDGFGVRTNLAVHIRDGCCGTHEVISREHKECKACMARGRMTQAGKKREVLDKLSENSI